VNPTRVAVMQPYFFPYAGYFRLFAAVDCFVILDCVQFNRRGRVHRTQLPNARGDLEWLTLPLARQSRDVRIRDLAFAPGARAELDGRLRRAEWEPGNGPLAGRVHAHLHGPLGNVVDFLEDGLRLVVDALGFRPRLLRSSTLDVPRTLKGQERIIGIVRAVGGTHYVNAPGGRQLYDSQAFAAAGLGLSFLGPYGGRHQHLLRSLAHASPGELRADVLEALRDGGIQA
jgi:hypothetical protein